MEVVRYCTPEWLESCAKAYQSKPEYAEQLKNVTTKICFLVTAEPAWGIEEDIIFGAYVNRGILEKLGFFSKTEAEKEADFILSASPQEWKKILRNENKFITDFMLGKITLEQGSKVGVLTIAPHANTFVDALTQFELQFPDDLSPEELDEFRENLKTFRAEAGV